MSSSTEPVATSLDTESTNIIDGMPSKSDTPIESIESVTSDIHSSITPSLLNVAKLNTTNELCNNMFDNINELIKSTMNITNEDYIVLSELNTVAASRYATMTERVSSFQLFIQRSHEQYIELKPYLESIKDLKLQVNHMNQVINNLDEYTKKLEIQFIEAYASKN